MEIIKTLNEKGKKMRVFYFCLRLKMLKILLKSRKILKKPI